MSQATSWLDSEPYLSKITEWIEEGATNSSIVTQLAKDFNQATSEASIRRFRVRHELNPKAFDSAFIEIKGDRAEVGTGAVLVLEDPDTMLRARGFEPEDWEITALRANDYQGPASAVHAEATGENKMTYHQTRFSAQRKVPSWLQFPRTDGWKAPTYKKHSFRRDGSKLVIICGDQQAPFQDPQLHKLFVDWLNVNQPHEGVLLGDTLDFGNISRHRADPDNEAFVNECLQTGYNTLRDYRDATPETWWRKLAGNHDERIRNLLLDYPKTAALHGIKRPDTPESIGEEVLALPHILRLDELGIEYVDPGGQYSLGQINLSDKLAVRHGWLAKQGSGSTALATLKQLGYSVIVGHTHRQSIVSETKHEITGKTRTLMGVEAGCMCRVDQTPGTDNRRWPNYTPAPDWAQGFCTAQIWADGSFNIDTAKYVNNRLYWRDQRYQ